MKERKMLILLRFGHRDGFLHSYICNLYDVRFLQRSGGFDDFVCLKDGRFDFHIMDDKKGAMAKGRLSGIHN